MEQANTNTQTMTNEEARNVFNQVISQTTDADEIAKLELLREYFTNADFRSAMHDMVWEVNQGRN